MGISGRSWKGAPGGREGGGARLLTLPPPRPLYYLLRPLLFYNEVWIRHSDLGKGPGEEGGGETPTYLLYPPPRPLSYLLSSPPPLQ